MIHIPTRRMKRRCGDGVYITQQGVYSGTNMDYKRRKITDTNTTHGDTLFTSRKRRIQRSENDESTICSSHTEHFPKMDDVRVHHIVQQYRQRISMDTQHVSSILRSLITEVSTILREGYSHILDSLLQEQFSTFSHFTEDYLRRSMDHTGFTNDYIS